MNEATVEESELVIEAGRAEQQYWRDLWRYRELFYFLAWRDILVRYKQTAVGVAWALSLHHRQWLSRSGVNAPSVHLHIQGGLSESSYWMECRPGKLAPVFAWQVMIPTHV